MHCLANVGNLTYGYMCIHIDIFSIRSTAFYIYIHEDVSLAPAWAPKDFLHLCGTGLDCSGLHRTGLDCTGLVWPGLHRNGLDYLNGCVCYNIYIYIYIY